MVAVARTLAVVGGLASAALAASYPVKADLNGRSSPSTSASVVKSFPSGTKVDVICQTSGTVVNGSPIWDKVQSSPDVYVSDYYVKTGASSWLPGVPRCSGGGGGGGGGGSPSTCAQKLIAKAKDQFGWKYSWGGGNYNGASYGIDSGGYHDSGVKGFDCSGLTLYSVYQATGKKIDHYTGSQYNSGQGKKIPFDQKQPGDLIFWANSVGDRNNGNANRHVAIFVSGSTTIDAYSHSKVLGYRNLNSDYNNANRMPYVLRFC